MMILLVVLLSSASVSSDLGIAWAEFSLAPALQLTKTRVEVGTLGYDGNRQHLDFWLRRTVISGSRQQEAITWTTTRTCGSARTLIASMRDIPVPKFAPVGSSEGPPMALDGTSYSLRTYSDDGMLAAQTNVGTPLASWIETALKVLEPCWDTRVPKRNDDARIRS